MTTEYSLSSKFPESFAQVIREAMPSSKLPEGIHIGYPDDDFSKVPKPFIVITLSTSTDEAIKCYQEGADNYVSATWDARELLKKIG